MLDWRDWLNVISAVISATGLIITIITLIRTGIIRNELKKQKELMNGQTFYREKYNENIKAINALYAKDENNFKYNDFITFRKLLVQLDYCDVVFNEREKSIIKKAINYCNKIYLGKNTITSLQALQVKECLDLIGEVRLVLESKEDAK